MNSLPQLICEQCRQRKRKCDKNVPCSACKAAGLACRPVHRERRPRGKSGKKSSNAHLEERIDRIEQLLSSRTTPTDRDSSVTSDGKALERDHDGKVGFWETLQAEVRGLRESIDDQMDDDIESEHRDSSPLTSTIPLPFATSTRASWPVWYPTDEIRAKLLALYHSRVDNVFKILHWPTALTAINVAHSPDAKGLGKRSVLALEAAIHFLAICTVDEGECDQLLEAPKLLLREQYKNRLESMLVINDLLQAPDIIGVQAFTIYVKALRACGHFSSSWTLLALAARMGTALDLPTERIHPNLLEREIRRRLWSCICLLDTQAIMDKGTAPLIQAEDLGSLPLNINDDDITLKGLLVPPTTGITDMSFSRLTFQAMKCQKLTSQATTWNEKIELVNQFADHVRSEYINNNPGEAAIEVMLRQSAMGIITNMQLLIRRPPYRQVNRVPADDNFDLFGTAISALEFQVGLQSPLLSPWKWKEWPPWYALAIVLAEFCKGTQPHLRGRAFEAAKKTYRCFARPSSDPESGTVWRPITKLMRRVTKEMERYDSKSPQTDSPSFSDIGLSEIGIPQHTDSMDWLLSGDLGVSIDADDYPLEDIYGMLDPVNGISWIDWDFSLR